LIPNSGLRHTRPHRCAAPLDPFSAVIDATPLLRLYARRRLAQLARQDPIADQREQLRRLVRTARATRLGRDHGFGQISDVGEFQRQVPLRRYESFWREYWQKPFPRLVNATWPGLVPFFALSSGTSSGVTKHIPVSHAMLRANRRAALDTLCHHLQQRPDSTVLGGRSLFLGGTSALRTLARGVAAGDLSGIAAATVPWWARPRLFPPAPLVLMADWAEKMTVIAPRSLAANIRSISGTPSWLLLFFDRVAALRPASEPRLAGWYPDLQLLIHGGVDFAPYRRRFRELLAGSSAETREVYPASEGFVAVADRGDGEGLRLLVDNGLFFEFVPVAELDRPNPARHWIATIEPGVDYAVVLTTCAGLWAYILGDTVSFIERRPPRLRVTGRLEYGLSAFGEHLIGEEIEYGVAAAAAAIEADVTDYVVSPLFPDAPGERGRHLFIVEFARPVADPSRLQRFAAALDEALARRNADYRDHRAGDFGMAPPAVVAAPPGSFAAWMRWRGKFGGQHKVPRVILDRDLLHGLRGFIAKCS
jgi:hypothetical protein